MSENAVLRDIEQRFQGLSPQLRKAARYVIDNPEEVALHSMRGIAARAGVHPNAVLRLARELGFESYEPFRAEFQGWILSQGAHGWKARARSLKAAAPELGLVETMLGQEIANLRDSFSPEVALRLKEGVALLDGARHIYVLGLRSLFAASYYFHYVCRLFTDKTILITSLGGTFADTLRNVTDADVLLAFSHRPYANDTLKAIDFARERGARILVVTDSKVSPAIGKDSTNIIVSNAADSLLPTLLPALAVAQVLATLLVASGSDETLAEIERTELQLDRFGVYVK